MIKFDMTGVFDLGVLNAVFESVCILILVQMHSSYSTLIDQLAIHQKMPILLVQILPDSVLD